MARLLRASLSVYLPSSLPPSSSLSLDELLLLLLLLEDEEAEEAGPAALIASARACRSGLACATIAHEPLARRLT